MPVLEEADQLPVAAADRRSRRAALVPVGGITQREKSLIARFREKVQVGVKIIIQYSTVQCIGNGFRIALDHLQQRSCRAARRAPSLFPVLQR